MATTTTNLGLTKPNGDTDGPDVSVINANMDLIDTAVGNNTTAVAARSISYSFGTFTSANIDELSVALINKFITCANGAHGYTGFWSGNWYFGGTIHKTSTDFGVITMFPGTPSVSQISLKIYNSGSGWNVSAI